MATAARCQPGASRKEQTGTRVTEEERLNDVPYAAERLAVSTFTVTRAIKAGHIRANIQPVVIISQV